MKTVATENKNLFKLMTKDKDEIISKWLKKVLLSKKITTSKSLAEKDLVKIADFYLKNLNKKTKSTKSYNQYNEIIKKRIDSGYGFNEIFEEISAFRQTLIEYIIDNNLFKKERFKYFDDIYNIFEKEMFLILNQYYKIKFSLKTEELNRDFLTGVYNRKALFERLTQELNRSKRYNRKIALLLLDLDNFKQVNDKYGHPMGDRFLKLFGLFLMSQKRGTDFTARIGGDEFAIILPETNSDEAFWTAKRLQKDFNIKLATKFEGLKVGLSIGITTDEKLNSFDLYKLADKNLLRAKKRGRNRVIISKSKKAA